MKKQESDYVKLARETVEEYTLTGKIKKLAQLSLPEFKDRAGVFVSIKKNGKLRGCVGTIEPTQENIAQEIINNAISAANYDPRFSPVSFEELEQLVFSVDILGKIEEVDDLRRLDPRKYGIIVEKDQQRGLLLPDLEGIDTVEEQLAIAKRKAGISPKSRVRLFCFQVKRYR